MSSRHTAEIQRLRSAIAQQNERTVSLRQQARSLFDEMRAARAVDDVATWYAAQARGREVTGEVLALDFEVGSLRARLSALEIEQKRERVVQP